jgi:hypothetical protein
MTLFVDPLRPAMYSYINGLNLGTFKLTNNFPWQDNSKPLYFTNRKTIYIDNPNSVQNPMDDFMNQQGWVEEIQSVSIYFVTDAKKLPDEYDDVVSQIKGARLVQGIDGVIHRLCRVTTQFIADDMLTTFVFSFRKILTN